MNCSIKTTYVMTLEVIKLLKNAEMKTGKRKEELITKCMRAMLKEYKKYWRELQQIEYQKRIDEKSGLPIPKKRVKVRFLEREYCYFQDVRKVFSRSISLAIAIAVFAYLDQVVMDLMRPDYDEEANNYPFQNYAFIPKCIENIFTFRIWWGVPTELQLLLTQ